MFKTKPINFFNAKANRKTPTEAENILWEFLRGRKFKNLKFRSQHPIKNYILDFFCYELNIAVEVDGKYHFDKEQIKLDRDRTNYLNSLGIKVIRLTNEEATNPDLALEKLKTFIEFNQAPSPPGEGRDEGL